MKIKWLGLLFLILLVACDATTPEENIVTTPPPSLLQDGEFDEVPTLASTPTSLPEPTQTAEPISPATNISEMPFTTTLGNPDAPVTIVEYSDYQCPFCRRHHLETWPQLKADYIDTGEVYYVFKDFPIASLHPFADRMHEAALCVGEVSGSDAYWTVHSLFFDEAEQFNVSSYEAMDTAIMTAFTDLGLPIESIQTCINDGQNKEVVQANMNEGQAQGVRGTPAFFVNGVLLSGAQPYNVFQNYIALAKEGELAETINEPVPAAGPTPVNLTPRTTTALGDPNAPVTIVEYSDYQCPFCRRHQQETMPLLLERFIETGQVYYVFKDFPIASLHPLAYRLHEAALCVGDIGGDEIYWQAHDLFFEQVEAFQVSSEAEMDMAILTEFEQLGFPDISVCLAENQFATEVQANIAEGQSLGIRGTPAFFIDGYPIMGAQPFELFEYAVGLAQEGTLAQAYEQTGNTNTAPTPPPTTVEPVEIPLSDEPYKGSVDAPITIIEYSDYQCPFCLRHFQQTIPQLQSYIDSGQVRYVFKDFPIHSIHPQAQKAHEAARCAGELAGNDGYWQMHDLLFTSQQTWGQAPIPTHIPILKELAQQIGLPQNEFDECLDSGRYDEAVNLHVQEGMNLGIRGTPSFFINGYFINGAQPFEVFQQAIEQISNE